MNSISTPVRSIVLIGLMGVGKSTVGRRLAAQLNLPFRDSDEEIERAAGRSVTDIFSDFGEAAFRSGERKVISRLLNEGPTVLSLGGGAFMDETTRNLVKKCAYSVWLTADIATLMQRVKMRDTRPLLQTEDPEAVMKKLLEDRSKIYSEADFHVDASTGTRQETADAIVVALRDKDKLR